jgi:hypothetical protein
MQRDAIRNPGGDRRRPSTGAASLEVARHMSYTVSAAAIELTRRKGIAWPYLHTLPPNTPLAADRERGMQEGQPASQPLRSEEGVELRQRREQRLPEHRIGPPISGAESASRLG